MIDPAGRSTPALASERLVLEPLRPEHAGELFAFYSHPEAMRFMPEPPHSHAGQTRRRLERDLARRGSYQWAVRRRDGGTFVGMVGYLGETRHPGLGYLIHPEHWGRGYAPEAVRIALGFGFGTLGYDRVELWIDERNRASRRVAEKLDFGQRGSLQQKYPHRDRPHTMLVYGLAAHAWRGEPAPPTPSVHGAQAVLMVHDVAEAVAFFRDQLGFGVDFLSGDGPDGPDHAGVSLGDWSGAMASLQLTRVPPERAIVPSSYLYLFVGWGLDRLFERYRERGVEIVVEPRTFPWGLREFAVRGPEGQVLRFGQVA